MSSTLENIAHRLGLIRDRIAAAEARFGRAPGSVRLVAVSKGKPADAIRAAHAAGQRAFGENYLQDALAKMEALADLRLEWHFIGPIQSNKTRPIALGYDWVHSVDRIKIARRLSEQRPEDAEPLDVCVQVNVDAEASKSGVSLDGLCALAFEVAELPRLRLRGVMAVPRPREGIETQRAPFRILREAMENLNDRGLSLDTLSMGMTDDMEAAIAEGATIVRIGTAIFGPR